MKKHANLECPECGVECKPERELREGGASYLCTNKDEHGDNRNLRFWIDEDGELIF